MISVCIASYNGAGFIREQVDSILPQLAEGDELIVSDDGSTDGTLDILRSYGDPRIRIFHHRKEPKPNKFDYTTSNFENALRQAKGDIIFLCDQDDVWLPDKVERMLEAIGNNLLVLSDCMLVDENLKVMHKSYFELNGLHKGIVGNLVRNSFLGSCMAFRRELLGYALPFPAHSVAHDIWLGLLARYHGKVSFLTTPTMLYRRHEATVSASGGESPFSLAFKIGYRIRILFAFLKRYFKSEQK